MRSGAVVLAGGLSTRMGMSKADLDRDGIPFVAHVVLVGRESVAPGPVLVAAAPGQAVPGLPHGCEVVRDAVPGRGPLEGLLAGLRALDGRADRALVLATDLPLVVPELGRALLRLLDDDLDAVVPVAHGHRHPLAAAYRVALAPLVAELLDGGSPKAGILLARCRCRFVDEATLLADPALARIDPDLESLLNVNTEDDLERARSIWRTRRD